MNELILWDVYEVSSPENLNGVMLRGRLRKLALEIGKNLLAENTEDRENGLRFALLNGDDAAPVTHYLEQIFQEVHIERVAIAVANPVLSKLKVNDDSRYEL